MALTNGGRRVEPPASEPPPANPAPAKPKNRMVRAVAMVASPYDW